MTAEPKFVPENAVTVTLGDEAQLSVRLVDCVGYMVDGAAGQFDEGGERMVTTPWFDHEVTLTEAAEKGTEKVITEHSTVGIVVTTDGSICEIPRESYEAAEARTIQELKALAKPFVVLLNCAEPETEQAISLAGEIESRYKVRCLRVNCLKMSEEDIDRILRSALEEFPLKAVGVYLPEWLDALPQDNVLRKKLFDQIREAGKELDKIKDVKALIGKLREEELISTVSIRQNDLGTGVAAICAALPRELYYTTISEETGITVQNDGDLIATLSEMSAIRQDYERLRSALEQIVRQGGKYSVKLKANAPAIHMFKTNVETEVTPAIGGESASEDIINFLLQGFDGDINRIWQSNIFGKSLNDIAEEGLMAKIEALPENARGKLRETIERVINEGSGGLICILL